MRARRYIPRTRINSTWISCPLLRETPDSRVPRPGLTTPACSASTSSSPRKRTKEECTVSESGIEVSGSTIEPAIQFHDVSLKVHDGKSLVEHLVFDVIRGETLVLLGRSGSGKTTTLKLINRLIEPTGGEVRVEGKSTTAWDAIELRRHIGYVIQESGLFPHFTVERNIGLVPRLKRWAEEKTRERVRELLELVGLDADVFAHRYPRE